MIKYQQASVEAQTSAINWQKHYQTVSTRLTVMVRKYQTRKQLAGLPKHLYQDVKLTEDMVEKELTKPFWK